MDWGLGVNVALDLADVHVRGVLEAWGKTVILADQRVKDRSKINVGVLISSIDSAVLVVKLNSTSNGLGQCEARSLGDNSL